MQSFTAIIGLNDSRFPGAEIIFELIVQNKFTKDEIRVTFSLHLLLFQTFENFTFEKQDINDLNDVN